MPGSILTKYRPYHYRIMLVMNQFITCKSKEKFACTIKYLLIPSLIIFSLLFSFCTDVYAEDITVGMSAAFKGSTGGLGSELYRGSMSYINYINDKGGINGRKIVIIPYDDGYNPAPAIENTIKLIEKDNVFLLFDYLGTPTVTRVLPLLKSYSHKNIYLFFPFTGAQPQRQFPYDAYVFNLRASYHQETEGLVNNFVRIGRKRIAVFYQADAYGRSGWSGVKSTLNKYGLKIIGEATYRRGAKYAESMKQQVQVLKESKADAVISIGAYAACAAFIRDARDAGWNVPIANVSFVGSEFLINLLLQTGRANGKDYTKNLLNSQVVPSYEDMSLDAVRQYRELMDKYNPLPPPHLIDKDYKPLKYSFVGFEGFLNAKLLVEILSRMGNDLDQRKIKKYVEGIKDLNIGIDAKVSFGPNRHQGLNKVYYTIWEQGRFIPIENWSRWHK
jgi:branched-chain amino acid transport system substrate-binding protein